MQDAHEDKPPGDSRAKSRAIRAPGGARLVRLDAGSIAAVFPIAGEAIPIGRDPASEIFVGDDQASKRHATLTLHGQRLVLEDLNSLNGTRVNERRVKAQELTPGDVIRIGRSVYIFLVNGMPFRRSSMRAAGWLLGRDTAGGGLKLPVTEAPLLIGRAPEADIRIPEKEARDFHAQFLSVPGGVQMIELLPDPPRCSILADGAELQIGATVLKYRAATAPKSAARKAAPPLLVPGPAAFTPPSPQIPAPGQTAIAPPATPGPLPGQTVIAPPASSSETGDSYANLMRSLEAESHRLEREERDTPVPGEWKCRITARSGPLVGRTFMFLGKRLTIGRDKKSRIHLDDKDVSRTHAAIWRHEGDVVIEDMESGNGVFLNGVAVRRAPLKAGDVIRIGSTEFFIHL